MHERTISLFELLTSPLEVSGMDFLVSDVRTVAVVKTQVMSQFEVSKIGKEQ